MAPEKKQFQSVGIARHDDAVIVLPNGMSLREGSRWLSSIDKELNELYAVMEQAPQSHPLDGAYALARAISTIYGHTRTVSVPATFFTPERPPMMIDVSLDALGGSVKVPWGRIRLPSFSADADSYIETSIDYSGGRPHFVVGGQARKRHQDELNALFAEMRRLLAEESIYRNKALRISQLTVPREERDGNPLRGAPSFFDVSQATLRNVILNVDVEAQLEDYVLTPIRHAEAARALGVSRKRGVLMHGTYGTGKTLTSRVIAAEAVRHGMTFIYLDNPTQLTAVYRFAMDYSPAVLFVEDVDKVAGGGAERTQAVNDILNVLDGIEAKQSEVLTVFTTNELGDIHQAFRRPGRIDVIIEVTEPDASAASRLVQLYAGDQLALSTDDLTQVGTLLAGNIPAIIAEAVKRAKLSALSRNPQAGAGGVAISLADIERASSSLDTARRLLERRAVVEPSTLEQMGRGALVALSAEAVGNDGEALLGIADALLERERQLDGAL